MLLLNKTNFCTFVGSVKSQVLLLFDIFTPVKNMGVVQDIKVSMIKLKFYWVFWTQITDGRF
nr:MAG TPA: hypothetical protein [Caudoviricetes sp.]